MSRLTNRVAVITGGASGIERRKPPLLREGAAVGIWDVNETAGKELELLLLNEGCAARFIKVNTAKFNEVEAATAEVVKQFGKIDILINNAGITREYPFTMTAGKLAAGDGCKPYWCV